MRPRVAIAGFAVACGLAAGPGLAACTNGGGSATSSVTPAPGITPSIPTRGPVPPETGPHHFTPGADSMGDPLDPGAGNGGYDVAHYALTLGYTPTTRVLTGDEVITAFATQDLSRFNLDFHGLQVTSMQVDNAIASYRRTGDELQVTPSQGIDVGERFTVHVRYGGVPSPYNSGELGGEGFLPTTDGAIVQGEPSGAASWFPVNDHPRDKATYEINVSVPHGLAVLSNGLLVGQSTGANGTKMWRWVENEPMASYLATIVIGNYRITSRTDQGRPAIMAVNASLPTSYDAVLNRTPEVVDFLETQFGPYPFDAEGGVIHADSRVGFALENQSRPVYSPLFFSSGARSSRGDGSGVLAHELTHQWYGDSVSVRSWSDIWLNEGFATYAEWLWSEHTGGATPRQIFDRLYAGTSGQSLSLDPPGAPTLNTMFGDAVYTRGAATLEALRIAVGDETFYRIIRGWAATRAYGNASTKDFIAYAEQVSGKSLDGLLRSWLFTRGKPPYPQPIP